LLGNSAAVVGIRKFWIQPNGLIVIGNGSLKVSLGLFNLSAVEVCCGKFWIKLDGLIVICDGSFDISLGLLS
jgi:hypothetical protein